jgi:hypothetical protein
VFDCDYEAVKAPQRRVISARAALALISTTG